MTVEIRRVDGEERLTTLYPLQSYAFGASPHDAESPERWRRSLPFTVDSRAFGLFEDGQTAAVAAIIPMTQTVRGAVLPMGGVAGVATHPGARRKGHARTLLRHTLADMRANGDVVSCLYPFRPSFYQRLGYAQLPAVPTTRFSPRGLAPLLRANVPGEVTLHRGKEGLAAYLSFVATMQGRMHGFALGPESRAARWADDDQHWVAVARVAGETVGVLAYRILAYGGDLVADQWFYRDVPARTLLLGWLARHVDQVGRVILPVLPGERPELWATDIEPTTEASAAFPGAIPPMARVLSVDGLTGLHVGPGRLTVTVVDETLPTAGGSFDLVSDAGRLAVTRRSDVVSPDATLTAVALAALTYGTTDPADLLIPTHLTASPTAVATLRALFPPLTPYLHEQF